MIPTLKLAGAVPPVGGVTTSQAPGGFVLVAIVNGRGSLVLVRATVWNGGGPPICEAVNVSAVGLMFRSGVLLTVRLTGMVCGVLPAGVTVTDPVYVPVGKPAGLAVKVRVPGVVVPEDATVRKLPPVVVLVTAVKVKGAPVLPKVIVCAGDGEVPI